MRREVQLTPAQRSAAVDRTAESIALLSGAGCGKTLVLARRFTELLLATHGLENPLVRFVALTFTEKAALEMSQRVGRMLGDLAARSKGADRQKLLSWLQELPDARISTIHGFCASLLRSYAIEAGIDPDFAVCGDELLAARMRHQAAEQAVLEAVEGRRQDVAEALAIVPYERLVEQVDRLVELRAAWYRQADAYENPAQILQRWSKLQRDQHQAAWKQLAADQRLRRELEALAAIHCDDPADKLARYRDEQLEIIRSVLGEPAARTADTLARLNDKPGAIGSSKNWASGEQVKGIRDRIKALVASIAEMKMYAEEMGEFDAQAAKLLAILTRLARQTETIYAAEKRRRGLLDFTDLLIRTYRLLVENPALRERLSSQIEQLLVDEAQDTDAFQIALLETLVFGKAQAESLADGRLFAVGDAKQSIYRFRGAQVEVFENLCRRLGPSRQQRLETSFRTHPAGVAFINHLFKPLMADAYQPIVAHRHIDPPKPSVEILLASGAGQDAIGSAEDAIAAQASVTARRIAEMVDGGERRVWDQAAGDWRPIEYGDIAVLFTRMTISPEYERQLALREIPYYLLGGAGFFRQQEVFSLLNALRVIDNPFDDVALFGTLRSSLIGLDDNALMHIAEALDPPYLPKLASLLREGNQRHRPRIVIRGLSQEASEALGFAVDLLGRLHRRKDAAGMEAILAELLDATGYEATLLSQFQGRRLLGNVRLLLERARSAAAAGAGLAEFITEMSQQVLSQARYEQAAVAGEGENVVRLITIHKAKGLEFPVVFVPDLNFGRTGTADAMLHRLDWGWTFKLKAEEAQGRAAGNLPLSYRLAKRCEDAEQRQEDIRRLYVAATRHQDHLVFVAADWRTSEGQFQRPGSYLRQIDHVLSLSHALQMEASEIPYGDGRYAAVLRKIKPSPPPGKRRKSAGQRLLAEANSGTELAGAIIARASEVSALALVGPLPATCGEVELAVTALVDFEHCPMLYRWRSELGVAERIEKSHGPSPEGMVALDPATMGTLYHRCMELLDFARPQKATQLVGRVVGEMGLEEIADVAAIAAQLEQMLTGFRAHPLCKALAAARGTFRELDFVMSAGAGRLRGQIDLLYEDADGTWRIVDYKSDHVGPEDLPAHARRYELQMLIYAAAAARHLGREPAAATLYFLRPAAAYDLAIDRQASKTATRRINDLAEQLITARRRGNFERRSGDTCSGCPCEALCLGTPTDEC